MGKRKKVMNGKRGVSLLMSAALVTSPLAGSVVYADTTAKQDNSNSSVVYAVDCGDINTSTAPNDGKLGSHNSVTDQIYGKDAKTGYMWGINDKDVGDGSNNGKCSLGGVSTAWTWPFEYVSGDQSSKLSTNRYTKNQYESGITTRNLSYKFELENGSYLLEVGFADPWGCSKSPSLYINKGQDDEELIKENIAVGNGETTVTAVVEVKDGELTVDAIGTGSSNLAVNMTYITIKAGGEESILETDVDAVNVPKTAISDIALPTEGSAGSTISWESSNPEYITDEGKVTRPAAGSDDAEVKLTATFKYGESEKKVTYTVKVYALSSSTDSESIKLSNVEVTDEYFDEALELDVSNMLKLDADRLLAGFRETAAYASGMTDTNKINAFMKNKTRYPGSWENGLIGGHILGHYISALSTAVVNPGLDETKKKEAIERLDYIISSLKECQEMTEGTEYEGFLFGASLPNDSFKNDVDLQFDNVERGSTNIITQAWVPWYTMHKILAGLVDAYEIGGNEEALKVAEKLGTWVANRANNWSSSTRSRVLGIEYGGMNDALYELYKVSNASNREDFKTAAHQFDETALFEAVKANKTNILNGKHANTTIPKFLGALNRYETDNTQTEYLEYAEAFWQMVIDKHTYVTGGNSEDEHFGADNVLEDERTNTNNETCNTYNMLKLSRKLFRITGEKKYADYYENTLINAIMSSQEHKTGMTMYFQPMDTGYQKVYSSLDTNFWCCTGTGYENFTKLEDSIYFENGDDVIVNLYLASKMTGDGYTITQTGSLAESDVMNFEVSGEADVDLRLRIPDWTDKDAVKVKFDGEEYDFDTNGGYIIIPNEKIKDGATFTVELPMHVQAYGLPDLDSAYAFKYGPFVLSAQLGTDAQTTGYHGMGVKVPTTKAVASDAIAIKAEDSVEDFIDNIDKYLVKDDDSLTFRLEGVSPSYTFTPHYKQNEQSYGIYWNYYIDTEGRASEQVISDKESNRKNNSKISAVEQIGRGQYENQYTLADGTAYGLIDENGTSIGEDAPKLTRKTVSGDSFSYVLEAREKEDNYLLVTYPKDEAGNRIKISVGDYVVEDETVASENAKADNRTLSAEDEKNYYQKLYTIPADVIDENIKDLDISEDGEEKTIKVIEIKFSAPEDEDSAKIAKSLALYRAFRSENALRSIECNGEEFEVDSNEIVVKIPYNEVPTVKFNIEDENGYIELNGSAIDEKSERELKFSGESNEYDLRVYAEDFENYTDYKLKLEKDFSGLDLTDSLVKAVTFDGEAPAAVDKSIKHVEDAKYEYTEGVFDKAISLDGKYGLELLDDSSVLGKNYTISAWINPDAVGSDVNPVIAGGTFRPEYWLNLTTSARIWSHNANEYVNNKATGAYKKNEWQNVVFTVEQSDDSAKYAVGRLYLNGELIEEGDVAKDIMTQSGAGLYFGVNIWDTIYKGLVDDVLLFNSTLTADEISAIASKRVSSASLNVEKPEEEISYTFKNAWGHTYVYDNNDELVTGFFKYEGNKMYANDKGQLIKNSKVTVDGVTYFAGKDGALVSDAIVNIWGKGYYFNAEGAQETGTFFEHDGDTYYADGNGQIVKSKLLEVDGDRFYMFKDGKLCKSKFVNVWGSYYYAKEDGKLASNEFVTVDGKKYYFNADGKRVSGWQTVDGVRYHFNSKGVMDKTAEE